MRFGSFSGVFLEIFRFFMIFDDLIFLLRSWKNIFLAVGKTLYFCRDNKAVLVFEREGWCGTGFLESMAGVLIGHERPV